MVNVLGGYAALGVSAQGYNNLGYVTKGEMFGAKLACSKNLCFYT